MKTQHTPGPWELRGPRLVTDKNGVIIAENISSNEGTSEANAHLIAAAPELLEALKLGLLLIERIEPNDKLDEHEQAFANAARAAIQKAMEEQP
jgi:hypothetical protein